VNKDNVKQVEAELLKMGIDPKEQEKK